MAALRLLARLPARRGARDQFLTRTRPRETLLEVASRLGVPLGQACDGLGVCGSCNVRVVRGMEHLTKITVMERKDRALDLAGGWRLACQAMATKPADPSDPASDADHSAPEVLLWHPAWGLPMPDDGEP